MHWALSRTGRGYVAFAGGALLVLSLSLSGCANAPSSSSTSSLANAGTHDVVALVREVDLRPPLPQRVAPHDSAITTTTGPETQVYYGDGSPALASAPPSSTNQDDSSNEDNDKRGPRLASLDDVILDSGAGARSTARRSPAVPSTAIDAETEARGYELNFENTPIATVAKIILGDILHVGYTIDPRVQATVTLASGQPVPRKDLLFVLENALRVSNVALVREGKAYRLIPAAEAPGSGSIDTAQGLEPGYGITVIPLQFVSAATLVKLLDNFAAKPGMVRADPARNLIVIQGNAADRQAAADTVHDFDADWMRGQSVGIFPVSNSTPEPVIAELQKIVDSGEGGLSESLVKLQPIARQNAILAVTRKPNLLKAIETWVTRLDKAGTAGTSVRVYRMRYGDARDVAGLLNDIFTGNSDSGLESPSNELAPGSGTMTSRSGQPNANGAQGAPAQPSGFGGQPAGAMTAAGSQGSGTQLAASSAYPNPFQGRTGSSSRPEAYSLGGSANNNASILPGVRIAADVKNNALLIYSNLENYRIIENTLRQLDRPQLQVAIDATIAEVTLNDQLAYGVQFFLQSQNLGLKPNAGSVSNNTVNNTVNGITTAVLSKVLPGFNFLIGSQANPQAILDALHSVTDVRVLSTPSIVVVDNQPATLVVGDQIPITTQTATSVIAPGAPIVNNIDYRNTGVILHVAPRINANGNVLLNIEQEISNVANNPNANTLTPTVSQRVVRSSIAVANGQTVLLAGLISENHNNSANGLPGLDQIPGLGILFSQNNKQVQRDELIIFIRPQIIRNGVDARRIAEELRSKLQGGYSPPPTAVVKAPVVMR
jgi:general secretion pathway protein D